MVAKIKPPTKEESVEICLKYGFRKKDSPGWRKLYMALRCNAPVRGNKCLLTFSQYMKLARKACLTRPSDVGRGSLDYNLCRRGDTGNYEWGNCDFKTKKQNLIERDENGGTARGTAKRTGLMNGRTKLNDSGKASQSVKISKNYVVTSPSGKIFKGRNLKEFCLKHSIGPANMSIVCRGLKSNHKGWTGFYPDET